MTQPRYEDLKIGQSAEVIRVIGEEDIQKFGDLSGDYNPLHFDEEWAKTTKFDGRVAHGLLAATFISTAIGMHLPGRGALYLNQSMSFRRPVRIGDTIITRVEVVALNDEKKFVTLKTTCSNQKDEVVLEGEALITFVRMKE